MKRRRLKTKKIGVLMGGISSERDVSIKSGTAIYKALKSLDYDVAAIDAKDDLCRKLKRLRIDIAFLALHGGSGENGAVQGMLEVMEIPYTGSGILASALAMDKEASKKIFQYHSIPVPSFRIVMHDELRIRGKGRDSLLALLPDFDLPWVVKPVSEGSSVGVSIVRSAANVRKALRDAFCYGEKVIIERYISGKEIQIGVLNKEVLGGVEVRPSLEFYNYEAKYTSGLTEYVLPPQIGEGTYEKSKDAALKAHTALGCSGATRVDLRVDKRGNPFVLEVNTIPGMTETSLLPKIANEYGLDFPSLLERILEGINGS